MPNKLLKTFTLDGTSFDVRNDRFPTGDINIYWNNSSAVSVPNNTEQKWDVYTAPSPGIILLQMSITYATNATGTRSLTAKVNSREVGASIRILATPGGLTRLCISAFFHVNQGEVVQMSALQNSGAALNVNARTAQGVFVPDEVQV